MFVISDVYTKELQKVRYRNKYNVKRIIKAMFVLRVWKDVKKYLWFESRDIHGCGRVDPRFLSHSLDAKIGGESHVEWWCFFILFLFLVLSFIQ